MSRKGRGVDVNEVILVTKKVGKKYDGEKCGKNHPFL
jgi:hypothetical protein